MNCELGDCDLYFPCDTRLTHVGLSTGLSTVSMEGEYDWNIRYSISMANGKRSFDQHPKSKIMRLENEMANLTYAQNRVAMQRTNFCSKTLGAPPTHPIRFLRLTSCGKLDPKPTPSSYPAGIGDSSARRSPLYPQAEARVCPSQSRHDTGPIP